MLKMIVIVGLPTAVAFYSALGTAPRHLKQRLQMSDASSATPSWDELRGKTKWTGLLPGDNGRECLDPSLRREILKYGDLTQVTYDAFEAKPGSLFFGQAYWNAMDLLNQLLKSTSTDAHEYSCWMPMNNEPNCNYIYAHPDVYSSRSKPKPRWGMNRTAVIEKYNLNVTNLKGYEEGHWIGYIAVGPSKDGDPSGADIVVAFRGTIMQQEWSVDFDFGLRDGTGRESKQQREEVDEKPRIHRGFLSWYATKTISYQNRLITPKTRVQNRLKNLIEDQLPKKGRKVKSITFVGHSLGGALAVIAARDIALCRLRGEVDQYNGADDETPQETNKLNQTLWAEISLAVFSFAAPRVGDMGFKNQLQRLNVPVLNVVNFRDMVPVLPDARVLIQFLPWWANIITVLPALGFRLLWPSRNKARRYDNEPAWWLCLIRLADTPFFTPYVNSGYKLYFDTSKDECLRFLRPWPWTIMANVAARHNLEVLLHMVATQYTSDKSKAEWRDVALMNKGGDLLDPYMAKELGIPVRWWSPIEHYHMAPRNLSINNTVYWRWRDKGAEEALTQVLRSDGLPITIQSTLTTNTTSIPKADPNL